MTLDAFDDDSALPAKQFVFFPPSKTGALKHRASAPLLKSVVSTSNQNIAFQKRYVNERYESHTFKNMHKIIELEAFARMPLLREKRYFIREDIVECVVSQEKSRIVVFNDMIIIGVIHDRYNNDAVTSVSQEYNLGDIDISRDDSSRSRVSISQDLSRYLIFEFNSSRTCESWVRLVKETIIASKNTSSSTSQRNFSRNQIGFSSLRKVGKGSSFFPILASGFSTTTATSDLIIIKNSSVNGDTSFSDAWVPDQQVKACQICKITVFGLFLRKHHCRPCGRVCCFQCSNISDLQVRVCHWCSN